MPTVRVTMFIPRLTKMAISWQRVKKTKLQRFQSYWQESTSISLVCQNKQPALQRSEIPFPSGALNYFQFHPMPSKYYDTGINHRTETYICSNIVSPFHSFCPPFYLSCLPSSCLLSTPMWCLCEVFGQLLRRDNNNKTSD